MHTTRWTSVAVLVALRVTAGCTSPATRLVEPGQAPSTTAPSAAPSASAIASTSPAIDTSAKAPPATRKPYQPRGKAGDYDDHAVGGTRPAQVYVPSGYEPGSPLPLVVLLHGYSVSGALQELYFRFAPLAEQRGFFYVQPDGTRDRKGKRFWNATDACCDLDASGVDDETYLVDLIKEIQGRWAIDSDRIFLIGHSNGGFMAHRLACHHADKIAAIVSMAGGQYSDVSHCTPSQPVAVLEVHGTSDATVLYNGGKFGPATYPGAVSTVARWALLDGCDLTPETNTTPLDLVSNLAGAETTISRYVRGCKPMGHAELWTIEGGPHIPALNRNFATSVVDFLMAHARSSPNR